MSPVFDLSDEQGRTDGIAAAVEAARMGRCVVLPTDTVYGIGTDAFSAAGVDALLAAKGRGRDMPPPVLIGDVAAVDGLATAVPSYARRLIDANRKTREVNIIGIFDDRMSRSPSRLDDLE